ncbi:recombinase [Actimicrobium sp. CCC2.4]|jgi:hypothetical protein|uniref:recombinase n=1 Tax=Actimicrobium sp. CCC2.4 TaxID=3048606 RepID=UPI002AC9245F|nr:recombinase [Actimicrobium sp. CCC2.4]MEB0133800.1 recombinase [Actimicrobium sp. CCC2.4]WPX31343.1 recombinase [Actimicrobium sp. CCC2.4]
MAVAVTSLYREFVLTGPSVGVILVNFLKSNAPAFLDRGTPLRVIVTEEEMDRLDDQIAYYFGPLMKQVCAQSWIEGRQFSKEVWHEHFAKLFLPFTELTMPDGEIVIKRGSLSRGKISIKKMNVFLLEVEAYAGQELGVVFEDTRGLA